MKTANSVTHVSEIAKQIDNRFFWQQPCTLRSSSAVLRVEIMD
jgi:hypothetical protein